jgi:hypothetical protein
MEHGQLVIRYRPKYQNVNQWYTDPVDLISYISYQSSQAIKEKTDSSQITFQQRIFAAGNITGYNSGTDTLTCTVTPEWTVNQWRWFTLIDSKNNKFKIKSNTADTLVLVPDTEFNYPGTPATGAFKITLPLFEIGDSFDLYVWKVNNAEYDDLDEDNLVFVGQIKSINDRFGPGGIQTVITLENITEVLFKSFNNPKLSAIGDFKTFMEKIRDYIVAWVNQGNQNMLNIVWDEWDPVTQTGNPITKRDGVTAFPAIDYYTDYKPNYEVIADLCQDKYTEDGEYYFYIKPNLNSVSSQPEYLFVVRPRILTKEGNLKENIDFKLINRTKDKGDIVTFLIIRCGRDIYKNNITTFVWGDLKYGYLGKPVAVNFAGDIMDWETIKDKEAGGSNFDDTEPVRLPNPIKNSTGSYTTYYSVTTEEAAVFPKYLTAGTFTTSNAKEYNEWVRWLAKAKAKITGAQFLLQNNYIKNKVTIEFYNTPILAIPGRVDEILVNSIGWTDSGLGGFNYTKLLRNVDTNVNVTNKGVVTQVTYEEDWELSE